MDSKFMLRTDFGKQNNPPELVSFMIHLQVLLKI